MTTATTGRTTPIGVVGTAHTRVEGREKVTGAARYAGEIPFADLAHGWLVLSTVARGRITAVDTEPVLAMPGVRAVLHHGNAPRVETQYMGMMGPPDPTSTVFQTDRVPHLGWPVALVVAETSEQAREAAESLVVHYEVEPHDTGFAGDRPEAHTVDGIMPGVTEKGDLAAELAASAHVVDAEYTTPEEHHSMMEPHAATARWDGGLLELIDSNQGTTWVQNELAQMFSLDPGAVRVRSEHIGGGFGSKGLRAHQVAAVMAATTLQRPVRVVMTRRQMFSLTGYRSPTSQRVRLGADADGRLRALEHRSVSQTSTVHTFVEPSSRRAPHHVRRRRPPHGQPRRPARRADADLHAGPRRGARVLRPRIGARRTRREDRPGPDRAARAQRTRPGTGLRAAVQHPQPGRLLP